MFNLYTVMKQERELMMRETAATGVDFRLLLETPIKEMSHLTQMQQEHL